MGDSDSAFRFPDLETARLALRILTLDDAESVFRHFSDDEVTRFMDIDSCTRLEDARDIIDFHLKDSGCRWGIFDKKTSALVGTCGYHCWEIDQSGSIAEIGYDLGKAYWGHGIMQETLNAAIPFGFEKMKLSKIYASVQPKNDRSIRLLARLKFRQESEQRDGLLWFNLYPEDWKRRNQASLRAGR